MIYETNPHRFNGRFAIAILLAAALLVMSCNPVKRVMKDPAKVDQIGRVWERQNPCVNDTITRILPGTTDTSIVTKYDTTYYAYTDTVVVTRNVTKRIHTRDTIVRTIEDVRRLNLARHEHSRDTALLRADIVRVNGLLDSMTERRDKWRNRAISTWVLLGLIAAGYLIARKHIA